MSLTGKNGTGKEGWKSENGIFTRMGWVDSGMPDSGRAYLLIGRGNEMVNVDTVNGSIARRRILQGGFSREVWRREELQDYIKGDVVFGYVGAHTRTNEQDAMVENLFRKEYHFGVIALAMWLCTAEGRKLADVLSMETEGGIPKAVRKIARSARRITRKTWAAQN